jgi:V8-like Glu-specific endopeptidase
MCDPGFIMNLTERFFMLKRTKSESNRVLKSGVTLGFGLLSVLLVSCGKSSDEKIVALDNPDATASSLFAQLKNVEQSPAPILAASKAVVALERGTGSFVSHRGQVFLMTNHHVLSESDCALDGCFETVNLQRAKGEKQETVVLKLVPVASNADADVSFFTFEEAQDPKNPDLKSVKTFAAPHTIAMTEKNSQELVGANINIVGHPHLGLKKWSSGKILQTEIGYVSSNGLSLPGSSGSPVLDDSGNLVGIHHSITNGGLGDVADKKVVRRGFHTPSNLLTAVLNAGLDKKPSALAKYKSLSANLIADGKLDSQVLRNKKKANTTLGTQEQLETSYGILNETCTKALDENAATNAFTLNDFGEKVDPCVNSLELLDCSYAEPEDGLCLDESSFQTFAFGVLKDKKFTEVRKQVLSNMERVRVFGQQFPQFSFDTFADSIALKTNSEKSKARAAIEKRISDSIAKVGKISMADLRLAFALLPEVTERRKRRESEMQAYGGKNVLMFLQEKLNDPLTLDLHAEELFQLILLAAAEKIFDLSEFNSANDTVKSKGSVSLNALISIELQEYFLAQ